MNVGMLESGRLRLKSTGPWVMVLGTAQDGGVPQAGCSGPCCRATDNDPSRRRRAACLAIVDPVSRQRWLIDCTPDFPAQLARLDEVTDPDWGLAGIFLTHAHVGHYTGLIYLGREVMAAPEVSVYALPRMAAFLRRDAPWRQLVDHGHVRLQPLVDGHAVPLSAGLRVTPLMVPHRDEISETAAFCIDGPDRSVLHLPDIDAWETWTTSIEDVLASVHVAWLDGTFFDADEIPGRDIEEIAHPLVKRSLERFSALPAALKERVRFTHLNHTNPMCDPKSPQSLVVRERGFGIAQEGERLALLGNL